MSPPRTPRALCRTAAAALLLCGMAACSSPQALTTIGWDPDDELWSGGFEWGGLVQTEGVPLYAGVGISSIEGETSTAGRLTSEISAEQEVCGVGGVEIFPSWFLLESVGLSERDETVRTTRPGGSVDVREDDDLFVTAGAYLRYATSHFLFELGYHTHRGVVAGVGFSF